MEVNAVLLSNVSNTGSITFRSRGAMLRTLEGHSLRCELVNNPAYRQLPEKLAPLLSVLSGDSTPKQGKSVHKSKERKKEVIFTLIEKSRVTYPGKVHELYSDAIEIKNGLSKGRLSLH